MDCPFCKINFKKNPIIMDGKYSVVIPSNPSLMIGHLLILPKRHVEKISDLDNGELLIIFNFYQGISRNYFIENCRWV